MTVLSVIEIIRYAGPILIGILLTRCGLSVEERSLWEQIIFYQNAVSFSFLWAGSQVQLTVLPVDAHLEKKHAFTMLTVVGSLLPVITLSILLPRTFTFMQHDGLIPWVLFVLFLQTCGHWLENEFFITKQYYKALASASITHIGLLIFVPAVYSFLPADQAVLGALWGMGGVYGLRALLWWILTLRRKYWDAWLPLMIPMMRSLIPLWGSFLVAGSAFYFDGWLVERFLAPEYFLDFRYGARELPISTVLASGISATFTHKIAQAGKSNLYTLTQMMDGKIRFFQRIIFIISGCLLLGSHWLFEAVYGAGHIKASYIFDGFLLLAVSRVLFPQSFILGLKMNRTMFQVSLAELIIHIIFSAVATYFLGIYGIVIGTLTAYFFEKFMYIYILHQRGVSYFRFHPLTEYVLFSTLLGGFFVAKIIYMFYLK